MRKEKKLIKRMKLVYDEDGNILWDQVDVPRIDILKFEYVPPRKQS